MNLRAIARALGGEVSGRDSVLCPGPGHSPSDRSLSVRLNGGEPVVHSFTGQDWQACKDHVAGLLGIPKWAPSRDPTPQRHKIAAKPEPDEAARSRRALEIWREARGLKHSPALTYLFRRGVDLDQLPDVEHVLRWHPRCPWGENGARHGCMLALWTDAVTGEPRAIHRTAIVPAGEKIGRKSLGPIAGCVIRLWPDEAVGTSIILGEGLETTASAATRIAHRGTLLQPAWACGDAGRLRAFPVLPGIEALTILVDHDANSAGQDAAAELAARWLAAGREVVRLVPERPGEDFNDIISKAAS